MVHSLQRLREPAAIVVLIVTGLQILLAFVSLATDGGVFSARGYLVDPFTALILGLLVGACALWRPTPNARLIALLAVIGLGAEVALGFLFSLLSLASSGPSLGVTGLLATLGALAIVALIGIGVLTVYRGLPAPQRPAAQLGYGQPYGQPPQQQMYGQPGYPAAPGYPAQQGFAGGHPASQPSAPPPATPPWQPDPHAGQSWRTAGEAASGASAADWGGSGRDQGWQPHQPPASSASAAEQAPPPAPAAPVNPTTESGTETRIVPPDAPRSEAEPPRKPADGPQWWDQK